jgi:pimeloyl-ACP methyl ester carboxylesterase
MLEQQIVVNNDSINLSGTLVLPPNDGPHPIVVMIHGSGPLDRNENVRGQNLDIFNTIADALAEQGIGSFRYDKRGVGESTGDYHSAGHTDLVNDASACFQNLTKQEGCDPDKIFLLGHSEGTIIAPQVSNRHNNVAGIILIAPFIDKLESILMKQAKEIKESTKDMPGFKMFLIRSYLKIFDPVKSNAKLIQKIKKSDKDVQRSMFQKIPAKWLREIIQLNPEEIYRDVRCPALIIGGSKDVQCNPEDVATIANVIQGDVESHLIENLSHILRMEEGIPSVFGYKEQMKNPVHPSVLDLITKWVKKENRKTMG